jgi:hypothetical protein
MRKIKKFRIPIYTYDILRKAKKRKIDLFALGLAEQESAKEYIASLAAALEPSTVFDLLSPGEDLAGSAGLAQGGSGTLGVITLGAAFEARLNTVTDPGLFRLAETAALVFAETGLKVVSELIDQEISAEGLTLGDPVQIFSFRPLSDGSASPGNSFAEPRPEAESEPSALADMGVAAACLTRLSADKIGVALTGGVISPKHTVIFGIPWLAPKKKKPAAGPASR